MSEKWKTNLIKVMSATVCVSYFPSLFSTSAARISKYEDWTPAVRTQRILFQTQCSLVTNRVRTVYRCLVL